jgi:hypothetical protein
LFAQLKFGSSKFNMVVTEEQIYHEFKDSLPIYEKLILAGDRSLRTRMNIMALQNTYRIYYSIYTTRSLGLDDAAYKRLRNADDILYQSKLKDWFGNNLIRYIKDSITNRDIACFYVIRLDLEKQALLADAIKAAEIIFLFDMQVQQPPDERMKNDSIRIELEHNIEYWRQNYFTPIESWPKVISWEEMKKWIKEYGDLYDYEHRWRDF